MYKQRTSIEPFETEHDDVIVSLEKDLLLDLLNKNAELLREFVLAQRLDKAISQCYLIIQFCKEQKRIMDIRSA